MKIIVSMWTEIIVKIEFDNNRNIYIITYMHMYIWRSVCRYKDRMLALRALTKDKPYDSLENVIWWIEFVMRHNGAPHLRFSGVDTAWYQQFDLDVIVFLTITLFLVLCAILSIVAWVLRQLYTYHDIGSRLRKNIKLISTHKIKSA